MIPHWTRFFCGDFTAFKTVSWYYNYHADKDPFDRKKWWCACRDDSGNLYLPKGEERESKCFGGSEEMEFVPLIYSPNVTEFGRRNYTDPDLTEEDTVFLGYNEPNQADQTNIPPKIAAQYWYELGQKYPNKVSIP